LRSECAAGIYPLAIINTQAHFDHYSAVAMLQCSFQVQFYLHSNDERLLKHADLYRCMAGDSTLFDIPTVNEYLDGKSELEIGGWRLAC